MVPERLRCTGRISRRPGTQGPQCKLCMRVPFSTICLKAFTVNTEHTGAGQLCPQEHSLEMHGALTCALDPPLDYGSDRFSRQLRFFCALIVRYGKIKPVGVILYSPWQTYGNTHPGPQREELSLCLPQWLFLRGQRWRTLV